jgi:hypothetical protein
MEVLHTARCLLLHPTLWILTVEALRLDMEAILSSHILIHMPPVAMKGMEIRNHILELPLLLLLLLHLPDMVTQVHILLLLQPQHPVMQVMVMVLLHLPLPLLLSLQ